MTQLLINIRVKSFAMLFLSIFFHGLSHAEKMEKSLNLLIQKLFTVPADETNVVVVLPFMTLQGESTEFGKYLAERLEYEAHFQKNYPIASRRRVDQVLTEMGLNQATDLDIAEVQEIAKKAGVKLIGMGTYRDLGKTIHLSARLIDVEKGELAQVGHIEFDADSSVRILMARKSPSLLKTDPKPEPARINKGALLFEDTGRQSDGVVPPNKTGSPDLKVYYLNRQIRMASPFIVTDQPKRFDYVLNLSSGDFVWEGTAQKTGGLDSSFFGLSFRQTGPEDFVFAGINLEGRYRLEKRSKGRLEVLAEGSDKTAIPPRNNKEHKIQVRALGPVIQLFVNDRMIAEAKSDGAVQGRISISLDPSLQMVWDDMRIFEVEPDGATVSE